MVALIVAFSNNRVIGKDGVIPWNIDGEKKRFKNLTTGNVVIMGRKTFEEIGRPLPNRDTVVVSNTGTYEFENCKTAGSLRDAIEVARESFGLDKDIYISGGAAIYKEAISFVDVMYITEIDADIKGDTYFPEFEKQDFYKFEIEHVDGELPYTYVTYVRR